MFAMHNSRSISASREVPNPKSQGEQKAEKLKAEMLDRQERRAKKIPRFPASLPPAPASSGATVKAAHAASTSVAAGASEVSVPAIKGAAVVE